MNFYRRFLPGIARILLPLTASLANNAKPFLLYNSMEEAFTLAKAALSPATTLTHLDPTAPVSLAVDASNSHVGAVLQQLERNS